MPLSSLKAQIISINKSPSPGLPGAKSGRVVKRENIPLAENPCVISAWAVCFSPPFVYYYSSILDIIHSWPIDSYQFSIKSFYIHAIALFSHSDGFLPFLGSEVDHIVRYKTTIPTTIILNYLFILIRFASYNGLIVCPWEFLKVDPGVEKPKFPRLRLQHEIILTFRG
jgi:hypothetical protein